MESNVKTWNLLVLATVVVVLLIISFLVTISRMSDEAAGDPSQATQTTAYAPERVVVNNENGDESAGTNSNVVDRQPSNVPDANEAQVQELLDSFQDESVGASGAPNRSGQGSPFASDEYNERERIMREQGLDELPPPDPAIVPQSQPTPTYIPPAATSDPVYVPPAPIEVPTFSANSLQDCGTIEIPSSLSAQQRLLNSAASHPVVECLGEAIGEGCVAAEARIEVAGDVVNTLYVVERNDGVCSLGSSVGGDTVSLCSLTSIMRESTGEDRSFDEWAEEFAADPGDTLADLITTNPNILSTATYEYECEFYELE